MFYALIVAASFTGTIRLVYQEGIGSAVSFVVMWGAICLAALLHPPETGCIVFVVVYIALIPCTYLLMNVYSVINLNNVSWGTREAGVHHDYAEEKKKYCDSNSRPEINSSNDEENRNDLKKFTGMKIVHFHTNTNGVSVGHAYIMFMNRYF